MTEVPKDSTRCRASSFPTAFDCAFRWEGEQLLGMRKPSGAPALLGQALHHGTAVYDLAKMQGQPITIAQGAEAIVEMIRHPEFDVDWRADAKDFRPKQVEDIALNLYTRYVADWVPRTEYQAVELTVKPLTIDCGGGVKITLTGTLDRMRLLKPVQPAPPGPGDGPGLEGRDREIPLVLASAKPRIRDLKSGRAAVTLDETTGLPRAVTKKHRAQLGVYEILAEHTLGVEVDTTSDVLAFGTTGKLPIAEGTVGGNRDLLLGQPGGPPGLIELLSDNLRAGRFPPNPNSPLCSPKYCPRWDSCPYHE